MASQFPKVSQRSVDSGHVVTGSALQPGVAPGPAGFRTKSQKAKAKRMFGQRTLCQM